MFNLTKMSYTVLSTYDPEHSGCPRKFEYMFPLALPAPMPWSLFLGRCFHEGLAKAYEGRVKDPHGPVLVDEAEETYFEWMAGGVTDAFFRDRVNFTEKIDWSGNDEIELTALGARMLRKYLETVGKSVYPLGVELIQQKPFLTNEGDKMIFESHLDLVTELEIIDLKTSSRKWTQSRADKELQATCYLWNRPAEQRIFSYHVITKARNPQVQLLQTTRTDKELWTLEHETLPRVVSGIRRGDFQPHRSWLCPYCGYRDLCDG